MGFGFAPPMQQRPMMQPGPVQFPTMNLTSPGPAGFVPQAGGKPLNMGDIRTGLQKLGFGGPQPGQAAANQSAYSGAVGNMTGPVSYTPPAALDATNMGPTMGSAMAGGEAAGGAAAGADAAGAAGGAAAAGGGADIGKFLMAFLGL